MEFSRQDRLKSLLTELIASFIREEANPNPLITVTNLLITPNYREVTVYFTTIPNSGEGDALIFLKRKGTDLRTYVKKHSRMKILPHFNFVIDYGERHRQHIDTLTQQIEKKPIE